jgi:hypothetical protein
MKSILDSKFYVKLETREQVEEAYSLLQKAGLADSFLSLKVQEQRDRTKTECCLLWLDGIRDMSLYSCKEPTQTTKLGAIHLSYQEFVDGIKRVIGIDPETVVVQEWIDWLTTFKSELKDFRSLDEEAVQSNINKKLQELQSRLN